MNVIVLAGGNSDEREVSLRSGAAVQAALNVAGHSAHLLDPIDGIDTLLPELNNVDRVFIALHGVGGEDGALQEVLEQHNIPFVGSGSAASALCFDKFRYSAVLETHEITQPQTELVTAEEYAESNLALTPHVLKPNDGGSSIDTYIIRNITDVDRDAIAASFDRHSRMLIQELIIGTEITVGVLQDQALPVIEIIPPSDQEFDYENKYNGATQELCPPQHVSAELQERAQTLAMQIHKLCGCRDMSRTDMILRDNQLFVLETNTIPGLTTQSLLPKAAATAGLSMPELCDQLIGGN